jgi:L-aspartate oxidase
VGDSIVTDLLHGNDSTSDTDALVIGAQVLNKQTNTLSNYYATHGVVLASGGLAGIYQHSTNPLGFNALGSSVGLALRLEKEISGENKGGITADLEYVQFHPTSLYVPNEARFLLTEALRGEGAILRDADGRAFARDYHPNGELAPRDIVARAVFCETQKSSEGHNAFLDISHRDADWLRGRFPSIHAHLSSRNNPMDFTKECIPVIPAAHYTCGGVTTDLNGRVVGSQSGGWYRNLFAAGEAARTGLHGGNRLASTSLLEGLVFGSSVGEIVAGAGMSDDAAEEVMESVHEARCAIELQLAQESTSSSGGMRGVNSDTQASREAMATLTHLKSLMWDNVGVVRDPSKLSKAVSELTAIRDQADRLWMESSMTGSTSSEIVALRDAAYAGLAVAESALQNRVSGGAHYVAPETSDDFGSDGESSSDEGSDGEEEEALVAVARG